MGTTNKGIEYPSNYSANADVPADMQTMAEDIDELLDDLSTVSTTYMTIASGTTITSRL